MPKVNYVRPEIVALLTLYNLIRDCLAGEQAIKKARIKYLPKPNAKDESPENAERYRQYIERAVFYNVAQRTLGGLVGQVFLRDPVIEVPALLDIVAKDATGSGVSAAQLAQSAVGHTVSFGRSGLFVDYPITDKPTTRAQIDAGYIRPTFTLYNPWEVINWRTIGRGGQEILSLVVCWEQYCVSDDGFEMKMGEQYRVLRLVPVSGVPKEETSIQPTDGYQTDDNEPVTEALIYQVEIWRKTNAGFKMMEGYPRFPKDANGNNFDELPFTFIGVKNNDTRPDNPPMYDLCSLNVAHYRNSADYEEACFIVGQPTPYFAGLSQDWVKTVLKDRIELGSRAAVALPEGGTAGLLQCEANIMPKEAMDHKERQMVALGAKLVQEKSVQRTATEADIDNTSETSILASCAKNAANAFQWAFEWASAFVGAGEGGIKFELNTEFDLTKMTPEERKCVIAEWLSNAITFSEMRENLRRGGIATLDDEKAKEEIKADMLTAPPLRIPGGGNPPAPGKKPPPAQQQAA